MLYFIVQSIRGQLAKTLPPERDEREAAHRILVQQAKRILVELCRSTSRWRRSWSPRRRGDEARNLPAWFLVEVIRDLPRLAERAQRGTAPASRTPNTTSPTPPSQGGAMLTHLAKGVPAMGRRGLLLSR